MRRFINDVRAKGTTPVLFTLTPRNAYEDNNPKRIQRKLTDFTPAILAIAKETGTPVIDLNDISAAKLEKYDYGRPTTISILTRYTHQHMEP